MDALLSVAAWRIKKNQGLRDPINRDFSSVCSLPGVSFEDREQVSNCHYHRFSRSRDNNRALWSCRARANIARTRKRDRFRWMCVSDSKSCRNMIFRQLFRRTTRRKVLGQLIMMTMRTKTKNFVDRGRCNLRCRRSDLFDLMERDSPPNLLTWPGPAARRSFPCRSLTRRPISLARWQRTTVLNQLTSTARGSKKLMGSGFRFKATSLSADRRRIH